MPDPPYSRDGWGGYPPIILFTAALSLAATVVLTPVFFRGTWKLRCLAALLIVFPIFTFALLVWWVVAFAL
jgi:hypothetical protein